MGKVTFVDETTSGARREAGGLDAAEERLTLRELIRRRVTAEAGPGEAEGAYARAVAAFGRNGFLVLVGDRQVEELDETVELDRDTEVTFLRLVPLAGG
ncbi:hypothetical protein EAO71_29805 [Streptomyces sp. ms191]|uniref:hypothetical protein n=1 Tax=unclassified Streptomyces TaxID=2593676 RepID=UPI0011CE17A7|nr:hypothetical protein [Streptomyces sp. ms191]TXS20717.1 hypothetical protein EAO71_29805 [Streptomyces sp. ms191]